MGHFAGRRLWWTPTIHAFASKSPDAREYLADYPRIEPLQTVLYERKAYSDVVGEERGIERKNPKMAREIRGLEEELIG